MMDLEDGPKKPKKKEPPHPFSPEAYDAAQPTGITRGLSPAEFDQAQGMTPTQLKAWKLPPMDEAVKFAPRDMTRTPRVKGADPTEKGTPLAPFNVADPTTYANPILRQVINPALENPFTTAAVGVAPFAAAGVSPALGVAAAVAVTAPMVWNVAKYGYTKASEMMMTPEDRAKSEADPHRVSGEAAAVQALMLGLGPLIHVGMKSAGGPSIGAGMMEAGAEGLAGMKSRFFESEAGATTLGATAARHGVAADASPYPPDSPLAVKWQEAHTAATESFKDVTPDAVEPSVADAIKPRTPKSEPTIDRSQFHVDDNIHSQLLNTRNGADIGTLGSFLKGSKLRALFADVLETPVIKMSEPPGGTPDGVEFKGGRGDYNGKGHIFVAPQSAEEFIPTLLEEAAHEMRVRRGRIDAPQTLGEGFDIKAYENLPAEQSARKMVDHALRLRDVEPAPVSEPVAAGTAPAQAAVEGTGPTKVRGLSRGIEEKAIEARLTQGFDDLPKYQQVSMADQAAKAADLLSTDAALARRVALGETPAPDGVLPESVLVAVENKAIADGDVATLRDLAHGKLAEQATEMGQRIRTLAERDPESPVGAIKSVIEARKATTKSVPKATEAEVKTMRDMISKSAKKPKDWNAFVDSLKC
ncbi:MAG: hypothetical protein JWL61_5005 [Gemmatimonadetes bacterium]|nr:hypothetical protein [Gemmatimonadota bacterium]